MAWGGLGRPPRAPNKQSKDPRSNIRFSASRGSFFTLLSHAKGHFCPREALGAGKTSHNGSEG